MNKYFGVIYSKDGTMHLSAPHDTQAECLEELRRVRDSKKWGKRVKSTTVIKRDMSNFKENMIFGCPKSLDVIQERKADVK